MLTSSRWLLVLVVVVAAAFAAGLDATAADKVFRFGCACDLTKVYTFAVAEIVQAQQDYVELLNMKGGVNGYRFEFLVEDSGNEPQRALEIYERFKGQGALYFDGWSTPVGKAPTGALRHARPDEMAALVIAEALKRAPGVDPSDIDDVILGCAMPEAEQGMNVARIASLRAGVPVTASAVTVNRFCSSGLQAIAFAAERVMCGFASTIVAGGTESMSLVPMGGHKIAPNPALMDHYPDVYLSTGLVAENHARESKISREEQDAFALRSHQRALAAIDSGRFADEIVPLQVVHLEPAAAQDQRPTTRVDTHAVDEGPRRDTSTQALAKLRPAFHAAGTVTAGNSSQMSDGAAAVILAAEESARRMTDRPIWVQGVGWCLDTAYWTNRDLAYPEYVEKAARMAYRMAGISEPRKEINIAEPYDPFAYKELHHLEGLQLAPKGEAPKLLADGVFDRDGNLPATPSGGLLGVGNPIAAAGLMKISELFWQLRGEAGARQVPGKPERGVAQAWGDLMQVGTVVVMGTKEPA